MITIIKTIMIIKAATIIRMKTTGLEKKRKEKRLRT